MNGNVVFHIASPRRSGRSHIVNTHDRNWCGIETSSPDEPQQLKLTQIARALNAFVVGDDGERYESRKNLFGKQKVLEIN
jgi:hypothetical protein